MTKNTKKILAVIGTLLCLMTIIYFTKQFSSHTISSSGYTIRNEHVTGSLAGSNLEILLDADISVDEKVKLGVGKGKKIDFISIREEFLKDIFGGSLEGVSGIAEDYEGERKYPLSSRADLSEYVREMQETSPALIYAAYDIDYEELSYVEKYKKGDIEVFIQHRENEFRLYLWGKKADQDEQVSMVKEFATALKVEQYFDFEDLIYSEDSLTAPVRINGLPIVAVSRDVLLDKEEELYVLQYLGYDNRFRGMNFFVDQNVFMISCCRVVLPIEVSTDKKPIITVVEAIEALKANLDALYIDGVIPDTFDDEQRSLIQLDVIKTISLGYCAVYSGDGEYSLQPVYVFSPSQENHDWDYTLLVNAITGEVYQNIEGTYSAGLNKMK